MFFSLWANVFVAALSLVASVVIRAAQIPSCGMALAITLHHERWLSAKLKTVDARGAKMRVPASTDVALS
jgi:hypothetical protein